MTHFGVPTTSDGGWEEVDEDFRVTRFDGEPDHNTAERLDDMVDRCALPRLICS